MVCKKDVFAWFGNLSGASRIDVMYGLLNMCIPLELKFLGTCLEDMWGKKGALSYRSDTECNANCESELSKLVDLTDDRTRSRLIVSLAMLRASNRTCSNLIFNALTMCDVHDLLPSLYEHDGNNTQELLLLFTMAFYHPAFTFQQRNMLDASLKAAHDFYRSRHGETLEEDCQTSYHPCCPSVIANGEVAPMFHEVPRSDPASYAAQFHSAEVVATPAIHPCLQESTVHNPGSCVPSEPVSTVTTTSPSSCTVNSAQNPSLLIQQPGMRVNTCLTRSAVLPANLQKAQIKQLEVKGTAQRKRNNDRRTEYRIQVTWSSGEVTEVRRTGQELYNFHQQLINISPEDSGSVHRQERNIPYFPGPKLHSGGHANEEHSEEGKGKLTDYLRRLMVKVPPHFLDSELVTHFFGSSNSDQESSVPTIPDGGGTSVACPSPPSTSSSSSSSSSRQQQQPPPPAPVSHPLHQTAHFHSSSSSLSSSSSHSLPASPPPSQQQLILISSTNSVSTVPTTSVYSSPHSQHGSHPSDDSSNQNLKSITIYNSYHSAEAPGTPTGQTKSRPVTESSAIYKQACPRRALVSLPVADAEEVLEQVFRKERLQKPWDQLKKRYAVKELISGMVSDEDLKKCDDVPLADGRKVLAILESLRQHPVNGISSHPISVTKNVAAENVGHRNSPPMSSRHVQPVQNQILMPDAPMDVLVRFVSPVTGAHQETATDSNRYSRHTSPISSHHHHIITGLRTTTATLMEQCDCAQNNASVLGKVDVSSRGGVDPAKESPSSRSRNAGMVNNVQLRTKVKGHRGMSSPKAVGPILGSPRSLQYFDGRRCNSGDVGATEDGQKGSRYSPPQASTPVTVGTIELNIGMPPPSPAASPHSNGSNSMGPMLVGGKPSPYVTTMATSAYSTMGVPVHRIQQSRPPSGASAPPPPMQLTHHQASGMCPCTGASSSTPPPPQQTAAHPATPLPYTAFVPMQIGGVFTGYAPITTAQGAAAFLQGPSSNGFVHTTPTGVPPPTFSFIHSPDGLAPPEMTFTAMGSVFPSQQQMPPPPPSPSTGAVAATAGGGGVGGVGSSQQHRVQPPPSMPGFVTGPSPNVGFHGQTLPHSASPIASLHPGAGSIAVAQNHAYLVTTPSSPHPLIANPPPDYRPNLKLTCYNCGMSGHQGSHCSSSTMDDAIKGDHVPHLSTSKSWDSSE